MIEAQINKIEEKCQNWNDARILAAVKANYVSTWKKLFMLAELGDLDKPLTPDVLSRTKSKITRHILYMYSMESFIYQDLNNATRAKDESKIKYYGAFAAALSYIIYSANKNRVRHKLQGTTVLYRGLNLYR